MSFDGIGRWLRIPAGRLSLMLTAAVLLLALFPPGALWASPRYFIIRQGDRVIGHSEVEGVQNPDGSSKIREEVYSPYDFFPGTTRRELVFSPGAPVLVSYREESDFDGGREVIRFWQEGETYSQLFDFRRFFFFNEKVEPPGAAFPLSDSSPELLYRFFLKNSGLAGKNRKEEVRYFLPAADGAIHRGSLEGRDGSLFFDGRFRAEARFKSEKLVSVELPDKGIVYLPAGARPVLDGLADGKGGLSAPSFEGDGGDLRRIPVTFCGGGGTVLSGVLTLPATAGRHPAFVLLPGTGPYDRSGGGLMAWLSVWMGRGGMATLRFDKRGVGKSGGSYADATAVDFLLDGDRAVNYLSGRPEVDPLRMGILGHSEGALLAARIALENRHVRGLILMASPSVRMFPDMALEQADSLEISREWDENASRSYRKSLESIREAMQKKMLFFEFGGERLCLDVMDSYFRWPDPLEIARMVRVPVLIMHGGEDRIVPLLHSYNLNNALARGGNLKTSMAIFPQLDHFFGRLLRPQESWPFRRHIKPSPQVREVMMEWLKRWYYL